MVGSIRNQRCDYSFTRSLRVCSLTTGNTTLRTIPSGFSSRLLKNPVVSWSGWDSEGIRKNKDESPGPGVEATKPQSCRAKVSDDSLKQIIGPRHPLFWGSNSQQSAH